MEFNEKMKNYPWFEKKKLETDENAKNSWFVKKKKSAFPYGTINL